MNDSVILDRPKILSTIERQSQEIGFTMPSDIYIGTLLKTMIAARPQSRLLELGTGIGLSLAWMVEGMDSRSSLTTIDNDPGLIAIAKENFADDQRVEIICEDGTNWIQNYKGEKFDLIFADAWPGKYSETKEILELLKVGGLYIVDDMSPQTNWPEGHVENVNSLIAYLENREDLTLTKMNWSTGIIIVAKSF